MSAPQATCPSCGAPVQFRWSSAVQSVCPFCKSILVRDDLDLKNVGTVADLPPDPSPICLWTEGTYKGKNFQVLGRLVYEWENGGWNEWHIVFSDGTSGWLSDAQLQYAVSFVANPGVALPPFQQVSRDGVFHFGDSNYVVATLTRASYKGMEGELPFAFYGVKDAAFADLRTNGREFGTIDYSGDQAVLYLGEWVEFEELQLKNLRLFEGWS
jgi:Domain of unknown function (DUF4178)